MKFEELIGGGDSLRFQRSGLTKVDFETGVDEFVTSQLKLLDAAFAQIVVEAQRQADHYWAIVAESKDEYTGWESFCRIGTRAVIKKNTLSIEWYRNRYAPNKKNPEGKKTVYSTHLCKGSGTSYPMHLFAREPEWVRTEIAITEAAYAKLRERALAITKMRRAINAYADMYKKHNLSN